MEGGGTIRGQTLPHCGPCLFQVWPRARRRGCVSRPPGPARQQGCGVGGS